MLRLLLFIEPKPLPEHLFRNLYWLDFPRQLLHQLKEDSPDEFEIHVAAPRRFLNQLRGDKLFERRTYSINEVAITRRILDAGKTLRQTWISEFKQTTDEKLFRAIDQVVGNSIPDLKWDIVITFGEECRYSFASQAMKLNVETSPFSRPPFRHSFFLDHCGLFKNSAPNIFFGSGQADEATVDDSNALLVEKVKLTALQSIEKNDGLIFQKKFDRHILLPLQASNYSSFDGQCNYDSQIDYLIDVCSQIESDTGIVVTEHPNVDSIDFSNRFSLVVAGLRDMFNNIVYLPRAKYFPSASFQLLNQVDAVFTVASNVAPVASLLGRKVGTSRNSHVAYAADAFSVGDLLEACSNSNADNRSLDKHKSAFDWMFSRYVIPTHRIHDSGWLADYMRRRYEAFQSHGTNPQSFVETNLSSSDFVLDESYRCRSAISTAPQYRSLVKCKIAQFRNHSERRLRAMIPRAGKRTCVLINDTAELETYRHLGCNHVLTTIYRQLRRRGFKLLGRINGPQDAEGVETPEWVIINGEGSFHHDGQRARQLLQIAEEFKSRGAKIALVNSIWEENSAEFAQPLKGFDLVAVRDGHSQAELAAAGIESTLTADFSLEQWRPLDQHSRKQRAGQLFTDNIVYERSLKLFDASLLMGGNFWLMDHRQVERMDGDGCFAAVNKNSISVDLLTNDGQIDRAQLVVTGRFHVAMACVALGNSFVYVDSNTGKMTHLCNDIGLPGELLNVTSIVDCCDWTALEAKLREVTTSFEQYLPAIRDYRVRGQQAINEVFDRIADV